MKKIFRSLGLLTLAGAALFTASSCSVFGETYYYKYDSETKGYAVTGLKNFSGKTSIEIPSKHKNKKVTKIADDAFNGWDLLTKVKLPSTLKVIGNDAFNGCKSVKKFNVPKNVTEIGDNAFANCALLEEVTLPESLNYFGDYVFKNDNKLNLGEASGDAVYYNNILIKLTSAGKEKTSITVQEGTKCINSGAFIGSNATSITLPETVTTICGDAFVRYDKEEQNAPETDLNLTTNVNIPNSLIQVGNNTFEGFEQLESISLSSDKDIRIKDSSFKNCTNLKTVTITGDVSVDCNAFVGSGVESLVVTGDLEFLEPASDSETRSSNSAFLNVTSLKSVTVSEDVVIGTNTFKGCTSLATLAISKATIIEKGAFEGCTALTAVELPETLEVLGNGAFKDCTGLTTATIKESDLKAIGDGNSTSADFGVFEGCTSLATVNLNKNIKNINYKSFSGCTALATVSGVDNVEVLAGSSFENCTSLASFSASNKLNIVGAKAFAGCTSLATFNFSGSLKNWENVVVADNAFENAAVTAVTCSDGNATINKA